MNNTVILIHPYSCMILVITPVAHQPPKHIIYASLLSLQHLKTGWKHKKCLLIVGEYSTVVVWGYADLSEDRIYLEL